MEAEQTEQQVLCNFCNKYFKNVYVLNNHKKTAKYCLTIQEQQIDDIHISEDHKCDYCSKLLTTKFSYERHLTKCIKKEIYDEVQKHIKEKEIEIEKLKKTVKKLKQTIKQKDKTIKDKDKEIKDYKDTIERLCAKAIDKSTTTNNTINNKYTFLAPLDYTPEQIKQTVENNFTTEHYNQGQIGAAVFTYDNFLVEEDKQKFFCSDTSRNIFNYKTKEGTIVKDIKAKKLTKIISSDIISKSQNLYEQSIESEPSMKNVNMERLLDIKKLPYDNLSFMTHIKTLTCNNLLLRNGETKVEEINNEEEEVDMELEEKNEILQMRHFISSEDFNKYVEEFKIKYNKPFY